MLNLLKQMKSGILNGVGFVMVLLIAGVSYATVVEVSDGDSLTAAMWNSILYKTDPITVDSGNVIFQTEKTNAIYDMKGIVTDNRRYYRRYTAVNRDAPVDILDYTGGALSDNVTMRLFCSISGTREDGTSEWIIKRTYAGLKILKTGSFSQTLNTPEMYDSGGILKMRLYQQISTDYNVDCLHETLR